MEETAADGAVVPSFHRSSKQSQHPTTKLSDHWPTVTLGGKNDMEQPERNEAAERASGSLERVGSAIPPTPWTMLEWLINNLHLIGVNIDAGYCEEQQKPSACFRSLEYKRGGRPWSMKGEQRERLIAAIHREMNHVHKWEPITRYPGGWQDVCVDCGAHRDVPDALRLPNAPAHRPEREQE